MNEVFFNNLGLIFYLAFSIAVSFLACCFFCRKKYSGDGSLSRREKLAALFDFVFLCVMAGIFFFAGFCLYETLLSAGFPLYPITVILFGTAVFLTYYAAAGFIAFLIRPAFRILKKFYVYKGGGI